MANKHYNTWTIIMETTLKVPGVKVNRLEWLEKSLSPYGDTSLLKEKRPIDVFSQADIDKVANDVIKSQTWKATTLSTLTGIPGGLALIGTIPADLTQYFGNVLILAQKLGYLYGWPDLCDEHGDIDEGTCNVLTIFVGVMLGAQTAGKVARKMAKRVLTQTAKQVSQRSFIKSLYQPIIKQIAKWIGLNTAKGTATKSAAKVLPLFGALVSGGVTYMTFRPMAIRLQEELRMEMSLFSSLDDHFYFDDEDDDIDRELNLDYITIQACINMAKVDSDFNEKEVAFLTDLIQQAELSDEDKNSLMDTLKTKELDFVNLSGFVDNDMYSTALLENLIATIYNDDVLTHAEKVYIFKIAGDIGISRKDVKKMLKVYYYCPLKLFDG